MSSLKTKLKWNLRIKPVLSALLVTGLLASFSACTKRGQSIETETSTGEKLVLLVSETLRINITSEPPSLDWDKATDTTSAMMIDNMMDGLIDYDLKDKELGLIPALALKWEPSENARKWKITLREGVKWTDGQPFTSQNVIDAWKRLLAKETASEYAYFLFGLKNAREFNEGKKTWEEVGVKATSPTQIDVELDKSMSYFPHLLTHHSTYPIRADIIAKFGDQWTKPENIVTLGAYKLKVWQHDKMIVLVRNDGYYGEKALIKNIAAYMLQEQGTAINLFDSGKLDSVHRLPSVELRKLKTRKEYKEVGTLQTYFYGINVKRPPMDNVLVRRAIAMSIDRQQIVQMLAGGENPMTSWVPSGMFGYESQRGLPFNPQKAKALLKQAGYSDVSKFPKLEIKFNTTEDHQRIAENVQAQLKQNLGINVELKNEEWKVYLTTLKTDPPHLFRFGWQADYPDPDNFLTVMASFSDNNYTKWKNLKFDELILKGAGQTDREQRRQSYSEAQKILVEEDVPVIPFFGSVNHLLISDRLENYPLNVLDRYSFKGVRIK
jgi:oligopeptide transport system substrate-binding protein